MPKDLTKIGAFEWADLTVENASEIRDFYKDVIGFETSNVHMGEYDDYNMLSPTDSQPKVGICHSRGVNQNIPGQWMLYFNVEDLDKSLEHVKSLGGKIIDGPHGSPGKDRYCFIQDPSGASCAIYQKA